MKRNLLPALMVLVLALGGCQPQEAAKLSETPEPTPVFTPAPTPESTPGPTPEPDPSLSWEELELADWQRAYIGLLQEQKYGDRYALHDLDGDGLPELLLCQSGETFFDPCEIAVYTCPEESPVLTGSVQELGLTLSDWAYVCPGRTALLSETGNVIAGLGGSWLSLSEGELKVGPADDETSPWTEREDKPSPVLDGTPLPFYRIWAGDRERHLLFLPVLNAVPRMPSIATEEEKNVAQAKLDAVVAGEEPLYAVSTEEYQDNGGWMTFEEYCAADALAGGLWTERFILSDEIRSQDLNGDGIEERLLTIQKEMGYSQTVILSVQGQTVYAYSFPFTQGWSMDEEGVFWLRADSLADPMWKQLFFDRDQCYVLESDSPQVKLLYQTSSSFSPDTGIRRTTLDPQGFSLSVQYEVPVFSQETEGYQKINRFFDALESKFFSPENEDLVFAWGCSFPVPLQDHYYEWTAQVTEKTDKLVSVHLGYYWNMGGVNDTGGEGYTFRTDTGELLSLTDLAQGGEEEIKAAILAALEGYEDFYDREVVLAEAKETPLEAFTFFLTPEGFSIHLDRYELGRAGAEGDLVLPVELELKDCWEG